jgi:hypothetical protein
MPYCIQIFKKKYKQMKRKILYVQDKDVAIVSKDNEDYISLTDIARSQMQDAVIIKWLSLKSTIEYLGEPNSVQLKITRIAIVNASNSMRLENNRTHK